MYSAPPEKVGSLGGVTQPQQHPVQHRLRQNLRLPVYLLEILNCEPRAWQGSARAISRSVPAAGLGLCKFSAGCCSEMHLLCGPTRAVQSTCDYQRRVSYFPRRASERGRKPGRLPCRPQNDAEVPRRPSFAGVWTYELYGLFIQLSRKPRTLNHVSMHAVMCLPPTRGMNTPSAYNSVLRMNHLMILATHSLCV